MLVAAVLFWSKQALQLLDAHIHLQHGLLDVQRGTARWGQEPQKGQEILEAGDGEQTI